MFTIEMLPAAYGDCLWIEYGDRRSPRRILVDGGISGTYHAIVERAQRAGAPCVFELVVVTHVDSDHIDGVVRLLANLPPEIEIKEIWFNGWDEPPTPAHSRLGGPSGEKLTVMIEDLGLRWNGVTRAERAAGAPRPAIALPNPVGAGSPRPTIAPPDPVGAGLKPAPTETVMTLTDGMTLTLLSPTTEELRKLRPQYEKECIKAKLLPGNLDLARAALLRDRRLRPRRLGPPDVATEAAAEFKSDTAVANGSGIAFLAQFDDKSCLFAADALPGVIIEAITDRLGRSRLRVDALKVSHHGSKGNTSPELLKLVQARNYLVSTNGAQFEHPDKETIARILAHKRDDAVLWFNYASTFNQVWDDAGLQRKWGYQACYPKSQPGWARVEL